MQKEEKNTLWTRDFTIITAGSVVSMLGNAMSGFAMSLMVLDYTESTLLYAVYLAVFTIPQIIVPIVSAFTKKPDAAMVEDAFSCYNVKVLVPQTEALETEE